MFVQRSIRCYRAFRYVTEHPKNARFTVLRLKLYLKKKSLQNTIKIKAHLFPPTPGSREGKEKQNKVDKNRIKKESDKILILNVKAFTLLLYRKNGHHPQNFFYAIFAIIKRNYF